MTETTERRRLRLACEIVSAAVLRFSVNDGFVFAGNIAFAGMLAGMPFLLFALALTGFVVGDEASAAALKFFVDSVPEHIAKTIGPVIEDVLTRRRGSVLTFSALFAIWAASNGIEAVRVGLDHVYGAGDRHFAHSRLASIVFVLLGVVTVMLLAVLIILAPLAFHFFERWTKVAVPSEIEVLRYAIAGGFLWAFLWFMHRWLPSRPMSGYVLWPGVLATVLILGLAASAFSVYLVYAPSYALTYGALAGVIVTLLFLYLGGIAVIFGAEINHAVNVRVRHAASRPRDSDGEAG